jgi:hypothetical protein
LKTPKLKVVVLIAIVMILLLIWFEGTQPIQDDFRLENTSANGTSMLYSQGVEPLKVSLQELAANQTEIQNSALAFLAPTIPLSNNDAADVQQFLAAGGTIILADNFGAGNMLLADLGVLVRFGNATIVDNLFYEGAPVFPVVYDLSTQMVAQGVKDIALNRATTLENLDPSVKVLASTSPYSFLDLNNTGQKTPTDPTGPFPVMVQLTIGAGSLYVFSSPGTLSNGMLYSQDNVKLLHTLAGNRRVLLDQSHLATSLSTQTRIMLRGLFAAIATAALDQPTKLSIASLAAASTLVWYLSPMIQQELIRRQSGQEIKLEPKTVEKVLEAHPTWSRARLEQINKEILMNKHRRGAHAEGG